MAKEKDYTAEEIIDYLREEYNNETIEGTLLKRQLIRMLYKKVGDPEEKDFGKEMEPAGTYWRKIAGYTTNIEAMSESHMNACNREETNWQISYPSKTKKEIVKEYKEKGWHCSVGPYIVSCAKFVKHPKYKNLWVLFRSTRDHNRYEYIIQED